MVRAQPLALWTRFKRHHTAQRLRNLREQLQLTRDTLNKATETYCRSRDVWSAEISRLKREIAELRRSPP